MSWRSWEPELTAAAHIVLLIILMIDAWIFLQMATPAPRQESLYTENASYAAEDATAQVGATLSTATFDSRDARSR